MGNTISPMTGASAAMALAVVALFAGDAVGRKALLAALSPAMACAAIFLLGGLAVAAIARAQGVSLWPTDRGLAGRLLLNGLAFALFNACLQQGLAGVPAGWGNAIMSAFPLFALLFGLVGANANAPRPATLAGLAVAFLGIGALAVLPAGGSVAAKALVLAAAAALGGQIVLARSLTRTAGVLPTIAWQQLVAGTLALLAAALAPGDAVVGTFTPAVGAALAYEALGVNVVALLVQAHLLRNHAAADVGAFFLARPLFGLALAWAWVGEVPGAPAVAGCLLVGAGLWLVVQGDALFGAIATLRVRQASPLAT